MISDPFSIADVGKGGWSQLGGVIPYIGSMKITFDARLAGLPVRTADDVRLGDSASYDGLIKVYLGHGKVGSLLLPQQVFVALGGLRFYQPSFFGPSTMTFDIEPGVHRATFNVDVGDPRTTRAARLMVAIRSDGLVHRYADGAQLYRCRILAPRRLLQHATGRAFPRQDGDFDLQLFHVTNPVAFRAIQKSREIWGSQWNLQGTRRLANVAYAYLTSLDTVRSEEDLRRIAMSSGGSIGFQTTSYMAREEVLDLQVYRESTTGRTASLAVQVPTAALAPPHLLLHPPVAGPAYYEVVGPEIFRVGLRAGAVVSLEEGKAVVASGDERRFTYLVLGDPSTVAGLAAPYDEADVEGVMHLQQFGADDDPFGFWQANANRDLMTGRKFDARSFQPI